MSVRAGQLVGPYAIEREVGRGRFGQVWLGRHCDLGFERAIKIPLDPAYQAHLRNEARVQFALEHPNIVKTFDVNCAGEPPYMVMEYVTGADLRRRLVGRPGLPQSEASALLAQILRALAAAHGRDVVHGDLKPENVLLAERDVVKVSDFGVGKLIAPDLDSILISASVTRREASTIAGTVEYMSPEQRRGDGPDVRDDVYAAGVIACEMLTGSRPAGAGVRRLCERAGVADAMRDVLERALDERAYRYASADAMANAIRGVEAPARRHVHAEPERLPEPERALPRLTPDVHPAGRTISNSVGMTLREIPAGEFLMGADPSEQRSKARREADGDAQMGYDCTRHRVTISRPFFIATQPVTQAQWGAVMWRNPSQFRGAALPVDGVCWNDAVRFCERVSRKEGTRYRLPTEAEWEYACRAGTPGAFNGGDGVDPDDLCWHLDNSGGSTRPPGGKRPNAWGLFDMHGNVWEWCLDQFAAYPPDGVADPCETSQPSEAARVLRGGCWARGAWECRSSVRYRLAPGQSGPGTGLRVVRET